MKAKQNNDIISNLYLDVLLIEPISKILLQLKNKEFRDCDIKWLDNKLETYFNITSQTLGLNISVINQPDSVKPKHINTEYSTQYYLKYFTNLIEYFKTFR